MLWPYPAALDRRLRGRGGDSDPVWHLTVSIAGGPSKILRAGRHGVSIQPRGPSMTAQSETGQVTGTKDKDYNLLWFTEQCLNNALRMEEYAQDAERDGDSELAEFFRRAQGESRKGGEQGKELLRSRLAR
jgi:hypothetical protein